MAAIAMIGAAAAVLALLHGCYYNPVPENVTGSLVCTYNGDRAFAGDIRIKGEAITNGLRTFDPNGKWKLCAFDDPIICTVGIRAATSSTAGAQ